MGTSNGMGGKVVLFIVAVGLFAAAIRYPNQTKQIVAQVRGLISKTPATPAVPSPMPTPKATPAPDSLARTQEVAENYMLKHAAPHSNFSFLDWSGYSTADQTSSVTLHYRVQQQARPDAEASVQFTIQGQDVLKTALVPSTPQPVALAVASTPQPNIAASQRTPFPSLSHPKVSNVQSMTLDDFTNSRPANGTIVKLTFDHRDAELTDADQSGCKQCAIGSIQSVSKVVVSIPPNGIGWFDHIPKAVLFYRKHAEFSIYGKTMTDASGNPYVQVLGNEIRHDDIDGDVGNWQ